MTIENGKVTGYKVILKVTFYLARRSGLATSAPRCAEHHRLAEVVPPSLINKETSR